MSSEWFIHGWLEIDWGDIPAFSARTPVMLRFQATLNFYNKGIYLPRYNECALIIDVAAMNDYTHLVVKRPDGFIPGHDVPKDQRYKVY